MVKKILEERTEETKTISEVRKSQMVVSNRGNYVLECFCGGSTFGRIELSNSYIDCGSCGCRYDLRELKIDFPKIVTLVLKKSF